MSQFSDAFTEVFNATRPDKDPTLSYGGGSTPDATKEFDKILLLYVRGVTWAASTAFTYGQTVFPTTRMGRRFRVIQAGTSGTSEPSWSDYDYARVSSGTVEMIEDGTDFDSIYDVRSAKYAVLDAKVKQAMNENQYISDSRGQASSYLYLNLMRERDRYSSVGIA